jgi:hypothetical protein
MICKTKSNITEHRYKYRMISCSKYNKITLNKPSSFGSKFWLVCDTWKTHYCDDCKHYILCMADELEEFGLGNSCVECQYKFYCTTLVD